MFFKQIAKTIKNSSLSLTSLVFTGLIVVGCIYFYILLTLPDVAQLKDAHLQVPLRVYTKDGKFIAEFGEKKRIPITIKDVPPILIKAILDTEDQRFYEHRGVDFIGLVRAGIAVIGAGKRVQGASTITMQVARNFFLSPEKTYLRKVNEILLAFKIDHNFSKDEILELYLNKIYLGQHAYGVAAASYVYFGKPLQQLSLAQLALIAGLPQAPSRDNPFINPDGARERRNHVLERMLANGHITPAQYKEAVTAPLGVTYTGIQVEIEAHYLAEMVRNAMVAQFGDATYENGYKVYTTLDSQQQIAANQALRHGIMAYEERHGYRGAEGHFHGTPQNSLKSWQKQLRQMPSYGELIPVAVTNNNSAQISGVVWTGEGIAIPSRNFRWAGKGATALVPGSIIRIRKMNDGSWRLAQLPKVEGSLVALDAKTGAITALIGGFSYAQSSFNRAVQADRQAGSSFKPFIYAAALAKGYTLASVFNDSPITIEIPGTGQIWQPQNENQRFYGPMRLRDALVRSRNVVSVRVLQAIGLPYTVNYVKQFGFDGAEVPAVPSLALGVSAVSPLKMASGFAVFANGGYRITPYFIENITDRDEKTIFKANPARVIYDDNATEATEDSGANGSDNETTSNNAARPTAATTTNKAHSSTANTDINSAPRVIAPQISYLITQALKDVIRYGTASRASSLKRTDLAGKTGTTNDQVDAWFAGYNSDLVAVTWIGYDQPRSTREGGALAALPIWMEFIEHVLAGKPAHTMAQPEGITSARIDPATGLLAQPGQPNAVFEVFTKNTVPTEEATGDGSGGVDAEGNPLQSVSGSDNPAADPLF
jgi:penicillin-binding protein 1A